MDTDSKNPSEYTPIPNNCTITLDIYQCIFYRSRKIDIYSPDGLRLESIGYGIKRGNVESSIYRLKEQTYLLECLLSNLKNNIDLPPQGVSALGDVLYRMQRFCREYIN